jgi:hypothetical protein
VREILRIHSFFILFKVYRKNVRQKICPHIKIAQVECIPNEKDGRLCSLLIKRRMDRI